MSAMTSVALERVSRFTQTGTGQKVLLALSGAVWFGFLLAHLYSNLHIFVGADATNEYYEGLKSSPTMLWGVRALLVGAIGVHVGAAWSISRQNLDARRSRYARFTPVVTSYAARTMRWTGPIVLFYIVYHLLHLTMGMAMPPGVTHDAYDVYGNIVRSFQVPWVAAAYLVANLALGFHLWHGAASMLQSLGLGDARTQRAPRMAVTALAVLMVLGFVSMPLAVMLGIVSA